MSGEPVQNHTQPTAPAASADAPRRAIVLTMIVATAVIFIGLLTILYVRWAGLEEPSSVMLVSATPAFAGSEIIIEGVALRAPYRVTVGDVEGQQFPFYLDRGSYTLRIVRDDKPLYSADFLIQHNKMLKIDLAKLEHLLPSPASASATPRGS